MGEQDKNINDELGCTDFWRNVRCFKCGRGPDKTRLNIEGHIHHKSPIACINTKTCKRKSKHRRKED